MARDNNKNSDRGKSTGSRDCGKRKRGSHDVKRATSLPRKHKVTISFDPADRHSYLTGFATRKKERRAFGLAMQKVKDREGRLEERKEQREAQREKIEELERSKKMLQRSVAGSGDVGGDSDSVASEDGSATNNLQSNEQEMMFQDERTTKQFGGLVSVTTTFGIPSDDEERDLFDRERHLRGSGLDEAQRQESDVNRYIAEVKGSLGQKKKKASRGNGGGRKKGQHGAATMKGMGNATALRASQKMLSKFRSKNGGRAGEVRRGGGKIKKGKRGKM